ncbi:type II toxin-antitoxin system RelB/DinJ family antitoxin [Yokenella regensburgei]|uniref:type II toxin-antitoxin system RelB/DinJ family antitoxin n=1 Tax=Yokenella regensburgei TaxID=158877 RepID=UPI0027D98AAE|nr:type II toxin-antitoxin system RelB/DinJ family antitoxin [Yokenella regensburgei]MDQ4429081.1 type II toxin-antitoxin system RelB/DinJ family antitoxin [Yokenella regensburgei]
MAVVNVRVPDQVKDGAEPVLKENNTTLTDAVNNTLQYIADHRQIPFMPAPRVQTVRDVAVRAWDRLADARNALLLIEARASATQESRLTLRPLYTRFCRSRLHLSETLCWLHSASELPPSVNMLTRAFAQAQLHLAECDVALDGGEMTDTSFTRDSLDDLSVAVSALDTLVMSIGEALTNQSMFVLPAIQQENLYTGEFCTIHVFPQGPTLLSVTASLRKDLAGLLSGLLDKGIYAPEMGGVPLGGADSTYQAYLPGRQEPSTFQQAFGGSSVEGGIRFVNGVCRITWLTAFSKEPPQLETAAEKIGLQIEAEIRRVMQTSASTS